MDWELGGIDNTLGQENSREKAQESQKHKTFCSAIAQLRSFPRNFFTTKSTTRCARASARQESTKFCIRGSESFLFMLVSFVVKIVSAGRAALPTPPPAAQWIAHMDASARRPYLNSYKNILSC
jgi:hypothetical protein